MLFYSELIDENKFAICGGSFHILTGLFDRWRLELIMFIDWVTPDKASNFGVCIVRARNRHCCFALMKSLARS